MSGMFFDKEPAVGAGVTGANTILVHVDQAAPGVNNPAKLVAEDNAGNITPLAGLAIPDYRLIKVLELTVGSGTYTPSDGARALLIEAIAGGGSGGGAPTASGNCSLGSGAAAGAYSQKWLVGPLKTSYAYTVGAGGVAAAAGANGNIGNDTTFDSPSICTAKAGNPGLFLAAGTSLVTQVGGIGGLASSGVGDLLFDGADGDFGLRLSASTGQGGNGGAAPIGSGIAKGANTTTTAGNAGKKFGGGGSGAFTATTNMSGGAGADGIIRIWEFA